MLRIKHVATMRSDKTYFSSSRRALRAPTPMGSASAIATDLESRTDQSHEIRTRASNPSATTATPVICTKKTFATSTPRNIIVREPNITSLTKTRCVVADGFARADGSRGVRIARAIDTRDGDVLDATMATASAPHTRGRQLDRHELIAAGCRCSRPTVNGAR